MRQAALACVLVWCGAMPAAAAILPTADGPVTVDHWGYQLQGSPGQSGLLRAQQLANAPHDLLVIDFARDGTNATQFTPYQVARMQAGPDGRRVVAAYVSIGEASDFRSYWRRKWTHNGKAAGSLTGKAPAWLGPTNPDWPESRKVRYWDPDWQRIIYNDAHTGWLDRVVSQGFDAAYLDIVDAYYFWAAEAKPSQRRQGDPKSERQAAKRMIDFVVAMTAHARLTNPDFFVIPQNGEFILDALDDTDPARTAAYLDAVGAIAVEDTYLRGSHDVNNPFKPDRAKVKVLKRDFLHAGVPVLTVDYADKSALVTRYIDAAVADGFLPYTAPTRELDQLGEPYQPAAALRVNLAAVPEPGAVALVPAVVLLRRRRGFFIR